MAKVTIGYDVEFFAMDLAHEFYIVPRFIKGTKKNPEKLPHGGAWQRDNACVELNGKPASSPAAFEKSVRSVYSDARDATRLEQFSIHPGSVEASFCRADLDSRELREIGCEPDMNCWTGEENKRLDWMDLGHTRFAAGHMHFSWPGSTKCSVEEKLARCRNVDLFLGPYITSLSQGRGRARKKFYGKFGDMRLKPYGFEWRVPCNQWFSFVRASSGTSNYNGVANIIFTLARAAMEDVHYASKVMDQQPELVDTIRALTNDVKHKRATQVHGLMYQEARHILEGEA